MKGLNIIFLFSSFFIINAQSSYFQQDVNYNIKVNLDDNNHILRGYEVIDYKNNASKTLDTLYFHLWANAYSTNKSEFAKQKLQNHDNSFYYLKKKVRGYIDSLNFVVDNKAVAWRYGGNSKREKQSKEIIYLILNTPLLPGKSIQISTPFKVKLPKQVSRMGHLKQSYQITQWYPKPAVYDNTGWHTMPYLDNGEFYSEFGTFNVSITLPKPYLVGATGVLQTETELAFLRNRIGKTEIDNTLITNELKTINYKAEKVHDFAWFADKTFLVAYDTVALASGKIIDLWAFDAVKPESRLLASKRALRFYTSEVGDYPYPQFTVVMGPLEAAGGMEYPMITICISEKEVVIAHEAGHNWFYGILASNERDFVWMDEGLNSFYDNKYRELFKVNQRIDYASKFKNKYNWDDLKLEYYHRLRLGKLQPMQTSSNKMPVENYDIAGYRFPVLAFNYLEDYLGKEEFSRIMKIYFKEWQFKHPQPKDIKAVFERETQKNLSWFFDDMFTTTKKLNYNLIDCDASNVIIDNDGDIAGPLVLEAYKNNEQVYRKWFDGFKGLDTLEIEPTNYDVMVIDKGFVMPEYTKQDNSSYQPPRFKFFNGLESPMNKDIYFCPIAGWNNYDKTMLGILLHNNSIPIKNTEFTLAPMYSTKSKTVVGLFGLKYVSYRSWLANEIEYSLNVQRFTYRHPLQGYSFQYTKLTPSINLKWFRSLKANTNHQVKLELPIIGYSQYDPRFITRFTYSLENKNYLYPYSFKIQYIHDDYTNYIRAKSQKAYSRLNVEAKFQKTMRFNKAINLRLFLGKILQHTDPNYGIFPIALSQNGVYDNYYDNLYFGRTMFDNLGSRQFATADGGFKVPVTAFFFNATNNMLISANLESHVPFFKGLKFIKPYFDIAYMKSVFVTNAKDNIYYSGGLKLSFFKEGFEIYFPLVYSKQLKEALTLTKYQNQISFKLNLNQFNSLNRRNKAAFEEF